MAIGDGAIQEGTRFPLPSATEALSPGLPQAAI